MQSSNWAPEHSQALREYLAKGMSYSEIADAINSRFGTAYTRNATIGRGRRIGLAAPDRPKDEPKRPPKAKAPRLKTPRLKAPRLKAPSPRKLHKQHPAESSPPAAPESAEPVKLAASASRRVCFRWLSSRRTIAATPIAVTKRTSPTRF